jgi:hypothetical protein
MNKTASPVALLMSDENLMIPDFSKFAGIVAKGTNLIVGGVRGLGTSAANAAGEVTEGTQKALTDRKHYDALRKTMKGIVTNPGGNKLTKNIEARTRPGTLTHSLAPVLGHASARTGLGVGLLGGMAYGAVDPGEYKDEDGNTMQRSMLSGMFHRGLIGGAIGLGTGMAVKHLVANPILDRKPFPQRKKK